MFARRLSSFSLLALVVASVPTSLAIADPASEPGRCVIAGTVRRAGRPVAASIAVGRAGDAAIDGPDVDPERSTSPIASGVEAPLVAKTAAAADGRFESRGLATDLYVVLARTVDGASGTTLVTLPLDGVLEEIVVDVCGAAPVLRLRVERDDGTPFVGPVVAAPRPARHVGIGWWEDRNRDAIAGGVRGTTDEHGSVELAGLPLGLVDVFLREGALRIRRTVLLPTGGPVRIVWPGSMGLTATSVVARAGGAPVVRATYEWSVYASDAIAAMETTADASGRLVVPSAGGRWRLSAPGFVTTPRNYGWITDVDRPRTTQIAMEQSARLRGHVRRASDGAPLAGMIVDATIGTDPWGLTPLARTTTDADGRYALSGLPAGDLAVRVRGAAGVPRGLRDLDPSPTWRRDEPRDADPFAIDVLPGGEGVVDVDIVPGARLVGRVTDATGKPAIGVLVRASGPERSAMSSEALEPPFWEVAHAVTDGNGLYRIGGLLPDYDYNLTATRHDGIAVAPVKTPAGGLERRVDLAFREPITVEARVIDAESGAPMIGVPLTVYAEHFHSVERWSGQSGEDGLVRIGPLAPPLAEEELSIRVRREWWALDGEKLPLPTPSADGNPVLLVVRRVPPSADEQADPLTRALTKTTQESAIGNALHVRVVDPNGRPVPHARLFYEHERTSRFIEVDDVVVEHGEATVSRPAGGTITLLFVGDARADDGTALPLGWAATGPVPATDAAATIVLPRGRSLSGRVVDAEGRGVRGLLVRAMPAEKWPQDPVKRCAYSARTRHVVRRSRTDAVGGFRIDGLDDGERIELLVGVPPGFCDVSPLVVEAAVPGPVEVRLRPQISATVTVTEADGRPASGARVVASRGELAPASAVTGADGKAVLAGLDPEERYTLSAYGSGDLESATRELWKPEDTALRLVVKR